MKHLKPYKIFESSEGLTPEEFCERYLPGSFGTNKHKIVNGEIQVEGDVHLFNEGLSEIPKFSSVTGLFDVRKNYLKSFEFLPEECGPFGGGPYLIHMNPYEGELKRIVELTQNRIGDGTLTIYKNLFDKFIKRCLEYQVWNKGKSNEFGIKEAWHDVKLAHYKRNKESMILDKYRLLDLDDEEILKDIFNLKTTGDWIPEMIERFVEKIKSEEEESRRFYFLFLCSLIKSDEEMQSDRIKDLISEEYGLSIIYDKLDSVFTMERPKIQNLIDLVQKRLTRSQSQIERDDNYDAFVFIGRDKFEKKSDGSYRKSLEIENFVKIDLYDSESLLQVNMMKMRARAQGNSDLYLIWVPKGAFEEEKDSYMQSEISEVLLDAIDKKKTRIG
jgi:hypothetical protein